MSFGSYVFQLIVTDSVGSTTCTVKDGWVLTDALGMVTLKTKFVLKEMLYKEQLAL